MGNTIPNHDSEPIEAFVPIRYELQKLIACWMEDIIQLEFLNVVRGKLTPPQRFEFEVALNRLAILTPCVPASVLDSTFSGTEIRFASEKFRDVYTDVLSGVRKAKLSDDYRPLLPVPAYTVSSDRGPDTAYSGLLGGDGSMAGGEIVPGFSPIRAELIYLVSFWEWEILDIERSESMFLHAGNGQLKAFCNGRIDRLTAALAREEVERAIEAARHLFMAGYEPKPFLDTRHIGIAAPRRGRLPAASK